VNVHLQAPATLTPEESLW